MNAGKYHFTHGRVSFLHVGVVQEVLPQIQVLREQASERERLQQEHQ
jgi:hypothetical protein